MENTIEKNLNEIIKYDAYGNTIYYKNSNVEYSVINEYDSNNNLIHSKYSDGTEYWFEYDDNGNIVHYKEKDYEEWFKYDNGNVIYYKDSDENEIMY